MSRRKTDGERIAQRMQENWAIHGTHVEATAQEIDRIIKKRMAEAGEEIERQRAENARLRAQVSEYFSERETHPVEET